MSDPSTGADTTGADDPTVGADTTGADERPADIDVSKLRTALGSERTLRKEAENRAREAAADIDRVREHERREYARRSAVAQFEQQAAQRSPDADTGALLEHLDTGAFLTDTGEIDAEAVASAVELLLPEQARPYDDLGLPSPPSGQWTPRPPRGKDAVGAFLGAQFRSL